MRPHKRIDDSAKTGRQSRHRAHGTVRRDDGLPRQLKAGTTVHANRGDRRADSIVKNEVLDQLRKNQIAFGAGHKQRIHNSWRENRLASGRRAPNGPALYGLS